MSLSARHIKKTFGRFTALDDVSLDVPSGKLIALLGPSGSGKTTLLRILAGLEFADEGSGGVSFHGEDVTQLPAGKRGVGFVFQHYALFRHLSVFENIAFGLRVRPRKMRPSAQGIRDKVRELLELVQLDGLESRFPNQLSGGQRQRVALARALAIEPKILLLDEPFGALDAKVRKELRRWLRRLHEEVHLTTVFVTHDQDEAMEIADEIVIMNAARIEQVGTPQDVYERPASPFVIQFLGDVNVLANGAPWLASAPVNHPGCLTAQGVLYLRPHDIEIRPYRPGEAGVPAVVKHVRALGAQMRAFFELSSNRESVEVEVSRFEFSQLGLKRDGLARLRLRSANAWHDEYVI